MLENRLKVDATNGIVPDYQFVNDDCGTFDVWELPELIELLFLTCGEAHGLKSIDPVQTTIRLIRIRK